MKREFPPCISLVFVAVMSVAQTAMQVTLPFKIGELGHGLDSSNLFFTWISFTYVISGLSLGWVSHKYGPRGVMLTTLTICAAVALTMSEVFALWHLYALGTVYLMSICLFWSSAEHASTGLSSRLSIAQTTAMYCVSYSLGNAVGLLVSANFQKVERTGATPFLVSVGLTILVWILVWWMVSPKAHYHLSPQSVVDAFPEERRARLRRSLLAARIGIVGAYGVYALILNSLSRFLVEQRDFTKPMAGGIASLMLISMAATFAAHGWWRGWEHRLAFARISPFVAALGVAACTAREWWLIALGVIVVGVAAGVSYTHNLSYSLEEPGKRARNAGIHEALVGVAFTLPMLLSGVTARLTQDPLTIFWSGVWMAVTVGIAQNLVLMIVCQPKRA
jgi:MFS family permease